jgi:hypothetical protein
MKLTYHGALQHKTCLAANRGNGTPGRFAGFLGEDLSTAAGRRRERA